ncbi:ABC transporter permease [Sporichthya brevicatena]|uniref:ABC transporter permease n=1 Tax=Sporichthya brevicatena TaxID=171442 RepID=A0ABN1GVG8_9ACTN
MSDPSAVSADLTSAHVGEGSQESARSLGRDAWDDLRKRPMVIAAVVMIGILIVMAAFPGLFTSRGPRDCVPLYAREGPSGDAWFGRDLLGCDVYARTIYGARASVVVGVLAAAMVFVVGVTLGMIAGYFGGFVDTVISRTADVFYGIPFILGAIIVLISLPTGSDTAFWIPVMKVVLALTVLVWPAMGRLMRSSVLQIKQADYVAAARALGASSPRILRTHVLPNAVQPAIVYATVALGAFIGAEATLSYLGVGLRPPVVSWGIDINRATGYMQSSPHMLFFPAVFLSITVLAFIMLGDAVRDALDPKLR